MDHWVGQPQSPVVLSCDVSGDVPLPADVATIAWRAGLDLHPLDAREEATRRWLRCLVWPEHPDRARTLAAALDVAAAVAPRIEAGDLTRDPFQLLEQVPSDATAAVVHTATLAYVDPVGREACTELVATAGCTGSARRRRTCCRIWRT